MIENGSETVESMDDQIQTSPKTAGINPTNSNNNTVQIQNKKNELSHKANNTKVINNEYTDKASNESARRSKRLKKPPDLYRAHK